MKKGREASGCLAQRRGDRDGILSILINIERAGAQWMGPSCFWWCPVIAQEAIGTNWNTGFSICNMRNNFSLWATELEQEVQRCCGVPFSRDIQLGTCFRRRLDWIISRTPFQPPWFCEGKWTILDEETERWIGNYFMSAGE